jgi:hypothetical protein
MSDLNTAPEHLARLKKIKHHFPTWDGKHLDWLIEIDVICAGRECPISELARLFATGDLSDGDRKQVVWGWLGDLRRRQQQRARKRASWDTPQINLFHPEAFEGGRS